MNEKKSIIFGDKNVEIKKSTTCYILRDRYVLVKPCYCGICGSDVHFYNNKKKDICRGHEITGIIKKIGSKVKKFYVGQKVCINPLIYCGSCKNCRNKDYTFCYNLQILGITIDGALTNKIMVHENVLFDLKNISLETGVLVQPISLLIKIFKSLNILDYDKDILIWGAGTLGLLSIIVASLHNIKKLNIVIKYDFQKEKAIEISKEIGIKLNIIHYNDFIKINHINPEIIIETVGGSSNSLKNSLERISNGGKIYIAGIFNEGSPKIDQSLLVKKNISIFGSNFYNKYDFLTAISIIGKFTTIIIKNIITHKFILEDCDKALKVSSNKNASRCVKCIIQIQKKTG
mgnify:CR=1 FL=1